jgi:ATP-dependent DNA helicase RecG
MIATSVKPFSRCARLFSAAGRENGKERREILARLEAREIDLLVGTHALIQDDVVFKALALAVVDEQHRFGVREVGPVGSAQ